MKGKEVGDEARRGEERRGTPEELKKYGGGEDANNSPAQIRKRLPISGFDSS
jgi:hypothetical protein